MTIKDTEKCLIICAGLLLTACATTTTIPASQNVTGAEWATLCKEWSNDWDRPGPPFRIYGNSYYVGTCGIASILIAGNSGHVLIDGASRSGGPLIAANVEALGFDLSDVKILLHSHEHFDHVGGLAHLQARSGAKVIASPLAAPVLVSGQISDDDPQAGMHDPFAPVEVSATVNDGETISQSDIELTAMATPGHTPGALSWTWQDCENAVCKKLVYMDSLSPISSSSYRFSDHPDYIAAYKAALTRLAVIPCDIALTPHPAASVMYERIASQKGLIDDQECKLYADDILVALERRIDKETGP